MNAPLASRREFLCGFAAALALLFAPFERFFKGLRGLLAGLLNDGSAMLRQVEDDVYEWRMGGDYQMASASPAYNLRVVL